MGPPAAAGLDGWVARLAEAGVPTPQVDAELLAAHVLGSDRSQARRRAGVLTAAEAARLDALVARRAAREPLQLIIGRVGFRYLDLEVRPGVFIPRPETEVLAGEAIAHTPAGGLVIEPCTGTGAVACAVAAEARAGRVIATDMSAAAVALARANAARSGVAIEVLTGDLLNPVDPALRGRVDVLVSNPPYVAEDELGGLEPEVADWDPRAAVVAGRSGHEVSDRLIAAATEWLAPGGWVLLEVAEHRAAATAARMAAAGLVETGVVSDLAGRNRIAAACRGPAAGSGRG